MFELFRKKKPTHGFNGDRFELTKSEKFHVERAFKLLEGYAVHESVAAKLEAGITARGLSDYANLNLYEYGEPSKKVGDLNIALSSLIKAYSIYSVPMYLYDIAICFGALHQPEQAKTYFSKFIKAQESFAPDQIDEVLIQRDMKELMEHARSQV